MAVGQTSKEALVNALVDAATPATMFGIDWIATDGLTLEVYGGNALIAGAVTTLDSQTLALTASSTNYVEFNPSDSGTESGLSVNTTAFTAGRIPLWTVTTDGSGITGWTDERAWGAPALPLVTVNFASDANKTASLAEARADILKLTSVSLGATRDLIVPLVPKMWVVINGTTGGQSIRVIGASGTGITIANAKTAIVCSDGTNILRVTADNP